MKILCPTDFSEASVNSIKWSLDYLKAKGAGSIELIHCAEISNRSFMMLNVNDILMDQAHEDLALLIKEMEADKFNIEVTSSAHIASSKEFIPKYAAKKEFDVIVLGTKGLTNLKNITVGSTTEYIAQNSTVPLLAIPIDARYHPIKKIVLGIGTEKFEHPEVISNIPKLFGDTDPRIDLVQILPPEELLVDYDNAINTYFGDLKKEVRVFDQKRNIAASINEFAFENEADIVCVIHKKRSWIERIFHHSVLKDELFNISRPILILTD